MAVFSVVIDEIARIQFYGVDVLCEATLKPFLSFHVRPKGEEGIISCFGRSQDVNTTLNPTLDNVA